jgi:hypothetical protein
MTLPSPEHSRPAMKYSYNRLLRDDELRPHLERGDSIVFTGLAQEWHEIERQVERLGFGDEYAVGRTRKAGAAREQVNIRVVPVHTRPEG